MSAVIKTLKTGSQPFSEQKAQDAIRTILEYIGEDVTREGLIDTPNRILKSYKEIFAGYNVDPTEIMSKTFKNTHGYSEYVLLKDIHFTSTCEHHMLPFIGIANIAYIPNKKIVGISKLARVVEVFAKRMQIQESMNIQIANAINESLSPLGVAVSIEAKHMCMCGRGVNKSHASMQTHHFIGELANAQAKLLYLQDIQAK